MITTLRLQLDACYRLVLKALELGYTRQQARPVQYMDLAKMRTALGGEGYPVAHR